MECEKVQRIVFVSWCPKVLPVENGVYIAGTCFVFTCFTLDSLLSHLNLLRSSDTITIICRFDRCEREYNKINSLMKHVRARH